MTATLTEPFIVRLKNRWVMVLIFALIGIAMIAGSLFIRQLSVQDQKTLTATTTGHILAGAKETSSRSCGSNHSCHTDYYCDFKFSYTPTGTTKTYKGSGENDGECGAQEKKGVRLTAYYDPDHPNEVSTANPNSGEQRHAWLYLFIPGIGVILYAGWILRPHR